MVIRRANMTDMVRCSHRQASLGVPEITVMRMTRVDWILLPFLIAAVAFLALGLLLAGFLGLGVLGLIIGVMAQRIELEKDGAVSNYMATSPMRSNSRRRRG